MIINLFLKYVFTTWHMFNSPALCLERNEILAFSIEEFRKQ